MSGEPEDLDLLAGLYVLGVLEAEEARTVEELADRDPAFARALEAWQNRLAPMAAAISPRPAPAELWQRIDASTGGSVVPEAPVAQPDAPPAPAALAVTPIRRAWRSLTVWRCATAGFAVAAAMAGFLLLSRPEPTPYVAALSPAGAPAPAFLAELRDDGSLVLRPLSTVPVAPGKDLELWALPQGASAPVSLGVLPVIGRTVQTPATPRAGLVQLLVSLEPQGGSPTGAPTGPVLYAGTLKKL